jgi:mannose-6-phosphate isomerase-like protein (cupin superfamily)
MSNYTPESDTRTAPEHYHVLGATLSITADAETTDGEYLVLDMLVPPMFENGLHRHEQSEVFHVIAGEARLHVDGREQTLGPGTSGYVPGGEVHGFANDGEEVCRVIAVMTPGGAEGFFREVGQPTDDRTLPEPIEPTEEMLQSLFATGERHGFEFLGPLPERAD